jgi:hypothetical protein
VKRLPLVAVAGLIGVGPSAAGPYLPDLDELGRLITIQDQAWALGGLENVLTVKLKLKNTGSVALKDFVIGCIAVADSGTVLGTPRTTLYQALRPGQTKTFYGISVGLVNSQTSRAACNVLSAVRQD